MFNIETDIQDWVDYIKEIIPLGHGHYNIIAEQSQCGITMRVTFYNVMFATSELVRRMTDDSISQDMTMIVYGKDDKLYVVEFIIENSEEKEHE